MKACQVCGYVCNDVAPTCPNCGEASWALLVLAEKRAAPIFAAPDTKTTPISGAPAPGDSVVHARRNDDRRGRR